MIDIYTDNLEYNIETVDSIDSTGETKIAIVNFINNGYFAREIDNLDIECHFNIGDEKLQIPYTLDNIDYVGGGDQEQSDIKVNMRRESNRISKELDIDMDDKNISISLDDVSSPDKQDILINAE